MTQPNSMLEQALQRYGDNLYRLALILSSDQRSAEMLLLRVARSLAQLPVAALDDAQVRQVLLTALPQERRAPTRPASWAAHPDPRSAVAQLLTTIAQLPREQRQALAFPLVFGSDDPLATTAEQRAARRDALLALAARADHPELPGQVSDLTLPETCQAARTAMMLDDPVLHDNPVLRGHLALCEDCRSVARAWQDIAAQTEDALRYAMRPLHIPTALAQQMREAAEPKPPSFWRSAILRSWVRRAILPLLVLIAVAALVWPRTTPPASPTAQTGFAAADMQDLVRAARTSLYAIPLPGAWTQRYAMRWAFTDETFAPLVGQIWFDAETGRRRIQLTHGSGGGPYEMMLNDGRRQLWYGTTRTYAESIFPGFVSFDRLRVLLDLDASQQDLAFQGRLQSGAWALPADYLHQAETARLQSWGRQQIGNDLVEVIGFQGISALAGPADAPGGPADQVTVLLSIRISDGSLREVRELIGPTGGDQVSRLVWQVFDPEPISVPAAVERAFMLRVAWNGTGSFPEEATPGVRPELPLADPRALISPVVGVVDAPAILVDFPATPPPGATAAAVLPIAGRAQSSAQQALVYAGIGRSLTVVGSFDLSARNQAAFTTTGPVEQLIVAGRPALLRRLSSAGYMLLLRPEPGSNRQNLLLVYSIGYAREELLGILETLRPISLDRYQSQLQLFSTAAMNVAIQQLVLAALKAEPVPTVGQVRHTVATIFLRQQPGRDDLPDPYHYPAYGGRPLELIQESWIRPFDTLKITARDGRSQELRGPGREIFSIERTAEGQIVQQMIVNPADSLVYYGPERTLMRFPSNQHPDQSEPRRTLLRILVCGGAVTAATPGIQIAQSEPFGYLSGICMRPAYQQLATDQQQPRWAIQPPELGPAIGDLEERPMTTFVTFDNDKRVGLVEVRADNGTSDGVLIERWRLISDQVSSDPIPARAQQYPPPLLVFDDATLGPPLESLPPIYGTMSISDALTLLQTPLLALPNLTTLPTGRNNPFPGGGTEAVWFGSKTGVQEAPNLHSPGDSVFEQALAQGYALQMSFDLVNRTIGRQEQTIIYLGAARPFGDFLRMRAIWQSSIPTTFQIGDRTVEGWQIFTERGAWVLGEFDGTLLAFPDSQAMRAALALMTTVTPQ